MKTKPVSQMNYNELKSTAAKLKIPFFGKKLDVLKKEVSEKLGEANKETTDKTLSNDSMVESDIKSKDKSKSNDSSMNKTELITNLFKQGLDSKEIIKKTGFKPNTVYIVVKRLRNEK